MSPCMSDNTVYIFFTADCKVRLFTMDEQQAQRFAADNDQQPVIYRPAHPAGDAIRDAALEEAAKVCDDYAKSLDNEWNRKLGYTGHEDCTECADAIRALRGRAG